MKSSDVITESERPPERPLEPPPERTAEAPAETFTIGELAGRFRLATHVLRHWESMGLLTPSTRVNGRRRYGRAHIARVGLILGGKQIGMSLPEIRDLMTAPDGRHRRHVLHEHVVALDRRIAEIQASKEAIDHILQCRYEDFTECPNFQEKMERLHVCKPGQDPGQD